MTMKSIKILLIEDNEGDVILTKEGFEDSKLIAQIDVARDGMAAIDYFHSTLDSNTKNLPDLILLDINLPKKNGQEVLQYIKSHDSLKQLPVIMLTTSSSEKDILNSYKNYANCFIMKPVDIGSFMHVVAKIEEFWLATAKLPNHKM